MVQDVDGVDADGAGPFDGVVLPVDEGVVAGAGDLVPTRVVEKHGPVAE